MPIEYYIHTPNPNRRMVAAAVVSMVVLLMRIYAHFVDVSLPYALSGCFVACLGLLLWAMWCGALLKKNRLIDAARPAFGPYMKVTVTELTPTFFAPQKTFWLIWE